MPDRLVPATLAVRDDGTLVSPQYGDLHRDASRALAHANRMLAGNGLPARWRGRRTFTIVETGFGANADRTVSGEAMATPITPSATTSTMAITALNTRGRWFAGGGGCCTGGYGCI